MFGGLNLKYGLSLRPYGGSSSDTSSDDDSSTTSSDETSSSDDDSSTTSSDDTSSTDDDSSTTSSDDTSSTDDDCSTTSSDDTSSTDDDSSTTSSDDTSSTDEYFDDVTVLYGFEDSDLSSGVTNEGSLDDGTVEDDGVAVSTDDYYAGSQCAAFNQNGANSNDGILLGTASDVLGSGDFTVEAWVKDSGAAHFELLSCGTGASPRFNLVFPTTNKVRATFGSSTSVNSSDGVWTSDEWFHYAFVYLSDEGTWNIYINGELVKSGTNTPTRKGNAYIGHHVVTYQTHNGPEFLDEFRITQAARYTGDSFTVPNAPFPRSGTSSSD